MEFLELFIFELFDLVSLDEGSIFFFIEVRLLCEFVLFKNLMLFGFWFLFVLFCGVLEFDFM